MIWIYKRVRWGIALLLGAALTMLSLACGGAPFEVQEQSSTDVTSGSGHGDQLDGSIAEDSSCLGPCPGDAGNTSDGDPAPPRGDSATAEAEAGATWQGDAASDVLAEASEEGGSKQEKEAGASPVTCSTPLGDFSCNGPYAIDYAVPSGFTSCGLPTSPIGAASGGVMPCASGVWCELEDAVTATVLAKGTCR